MVITIIYGSPRKNGCSSNIARNVASRFKDAEILEIDLDKENLPYCKGCLNCVRKGLEFCPHSKITLPIKEKMVKADLLIIASPVYILHMSGQMKTFLDHFPSFFLMHRPPVSMFKKQAIIVSTAAGPVFKGTIKELKECFTFFGVPKIYKLGLAVKANDWKSTSNELQLTIEKRIDKIEKMVKKKYSKGKYHMPFKIIEWFYICRIIQKKHPVSPIDQSYWEKLGWLGKGRPWK